MYQFAKLKKLNLQFGKIKKKNFPKNVLVQVLKF